MKRAYNFSAGPAALPTEVLAQAQAEMLDWQGRGVSVMEVSHRSKPYIEMAETAEQDLRDLMAIPDNYKVLFLQGGATRLFSQIAENFIPEGGSCDLIETGHWSKKAIAIKQTIANVNVAASSKDSNYTTIPKPDMWDLSDDASYVHIVSNETIHGVEYDFAPEVDKPLIADMSSNILSRPIDVAQYDMIYAGAQKNIGPAGLTLAIIRDDMLEPKRHLPPLSTFKAVEEAGSMLNTPPSYSWYLAGLVFKWLKKQGGVEAMEIINERKAQKLYDYIDNEAFYSNPVDVPYRSWMNVPFFLADESLNAMFLAESETAGMQALKGHRALGGMRASIYNAVPEKAVDALISFMQDFAKRNG